MINNSTTISITKNFNFPHKKRWRMLGKSPATLKIVWSSSTLVHNDE